MGRHFGTIAASEDFQLEDHAYVKGDRPGFTCRYCEYLVFETAEEVMRHQSFVCPQLTEMRSTDDFFWRKEAIKEVAELKVKYPFLTFQKDPKCILVECTLCGEKMDLPLSNKERQKWDYIINFLVVGHAQKHRDSSAKKALKNRSESASIERSESPSLERSDSPSLERPESSSVERPESVGDDTSAGREGDNTPAGEAHTKGSKRNQPLSPTNQASPATSPEVQGSKRRRVADIFAEKSLNKRAFKKRSGSNTECSVCKVVFNDKVTLNMHYGITQISVDFDTKTHSCISRSKADEQFNFPSYPCSYCRKDQVSSLNRQNQEILHPDWLITNHVT